MHIQSIRLTGFKSFGERVELAFVPGVNAVVGPNGSGKSNVIEGLRWASHTARTRDLRAKNASELIFHGSGQRAALNLAEVQVELAAGPERISLARRLYRDGGSELELAGRPVLVRDLHERLRGSGLGPGGLAVVGQGEIGAVIGADGRSLLEAIEEAAGLSRSANRVLQTSERLAEASGHLERLGDLAVELRQSTTRLEREAAAARQFAQLEASRGALARAIGRSKLRALRNELVALVQEQASLAAQTEAAGLQLAAHNNQLKQLRQQREQLQSQYASEGREFERLQGEQRSAQERLRAGQENQTRLASEDQDLRLEANALPTAVLTTAPPLAPSAPAVDPTSLLLNLKQTQHQLQQAEAERNQAARLLKNAQQAQAQAASRQAEAAARQAKAEAEAVAAEAQQARLFAESATLAQELEAERLGLADHQQIVLRREQEWQQGEALLAQQGTRLEGARKALGQAATLEAETRTQWAASQRELERLERAFEAYSRFSEGPRKALQAGVAGVIGAVGDLLLVPGEYERAIAAALGRRVEQVVVEDGEVARSVIEYLKRVGGRATFLPLDLLPTRERRRSPIFGEQAVLGVAADLVQCQVEALAEVLLGDTLVVETLDAALRLARQYNNRPRLVTAEGELLEPGGAVTGGRGREGGGEHFSEGRRLAELRRECDRLEQSAADTRLKLERAKTTLTHGEDKALERQQQARREALEAEKRQLAQRQSRVAGLEERLGRLAGNMPGQGKAKAATPEAATESLLEWPDIPSLETALAKAESQLEQARQAERVAANQQQAAQAALALFAAETRAWQAQSARMAAMRARRSAIDERLLLLASLAQQAAQQISSATAALVAVEQALVRLDIGVFQRQLQQLDHERSQNEAGLAQSSTQLSQLQSSLEQLTLTRARREAALEALLATFTATKAEEQLEEQAEEQLEEQAEANLRPDEADPPGSLRAWAQQLAETEGQLQRLGPVNPLAAAQHQAEAARLAELEAQMHEAKAASQQLLALLAQLEAELNQARNAAVARVRLAFARYSEQLLGEGDLVFEDDGQHKSIALVITPKGKRTRNLHLLSAGEKTMAALAFLFALSVAQAGGGLPLAVLDEVDAPLDEANIRRFTHFLVLLAKAGTQFILVTHQKATMEIADAIWGVTTDERGLSRVYSMKQAE
jgi:chromosome segregation protein